MIFKSPESDTAILRAMIEQALESKFGFRVPVIIRSAEDFNAMIKRNPFLKNEISDISKLHVTLLSGDPDSSKIAELKKVLSGRDECRLIGKEIYVHCPDGYGRTKLTNNHFENKLGVTATSRNWKTINTLYQLSQ